MGDEGRQAPGMRFVIVGVVFAMVLVTGTLDTLDATPVATFVAATAALAGLAWLVSIATESLGSYVASLALDAHLTFELAPVYSGALALWQIAGDGEAYLFEGFALIALYVIVAVFAFLR